MPLFGRSLIYAQRTLDGFDEEGNEVAGVLSTSSIIGSIQPLSANEVLAMAEGDRQNGGVKVYTSSRLAVRSQLTQTQGFVKDSAGNVYELVGEMINSGGVLNHNKYLGVLVPANQIPEALR